MGGAAAAARWLTNCSGEIAPERSRGPGTATLPGCHATLRRMVSCESCRKWVYSPGRSPGDFLAGGGCDDDDHEGAGCEAGGVGNAEGTDDPGPPGAFAAA